MRVWRQEGRFPKQKLFAPGYQRPWPIWIDVEGTYWSRHVRDAWKAMKEIQTASDDDLGRPYYEQGRVDQRDSSEEGDSDVDKDGNIVSQDGNRKRSDGEKQGGEEKQGGDEKQSDNKKQSNNKKQSDNEKQGDDKSQRNNVNQGDISAGDIVAEKGSDGDEGRSESGAASS